MRRLALVPILVTTFLCPPAASALGLGDIELQSALNQRLDAEIPLRGVQAERSDDIIVTLASEQAFQDVGLQRPFSLTKLRFQVKQHAGGGYYVHVTSREAIVEPFLSFLIEVDWPGGNLLREYTVLLDPPVFTTEGSGESAGGDTPAAAGETAAAGAGVPGEIERDQEEPGTGAAAEPEPADVTADEGTTDAGTAAAEAESATATAADDATGARAAEGRRSGDFGDTPVFLQVEREQDGGGRRETGARATDQAERRERATGEEAQARAYESGGEGSSPSASAATGSAGGGEYGPVRKGETLWNIASRLKSGDMTVQQMMLALLRYNPEAFAGDNINRLKQGYVLRVPETAEVRRISAQQAVAQVGEQNAIWEEWRRAQAGGDTRQAARGDSGADDAGETTASAGDGEARLKIVGSGDNGGAGSDEQASATGDASASASEQLNLARERLESAEMEKAELKSRVDELEQTVEKMEQLITLRENKLNQLQEQLEKLRQDEGTPEDTEVAAATGGDGSGSGGTGSGSGDAADGGDAGAGDAGGTAGETTTAAEADTDAGPADAGSTETATTDGAADGGGSGAAGEAAGTEDAASAAEDAAGGEASGTATADSGTATDAGTTAESDTAATDDGATSAAESGGEQGREQTDPGVVTTRTQPAEKGWLDTITGIGASIAATATGAVGGGLFAGPMSPGVLALGGLVILALLLILVRRRRAGAEDEADAGMEELEPIGEDWAGAEEADLDHMESGSDVIAEELGGARDTGAADLESSLVEENFDFGSLDAGDEAVHADEEEAPKDDTVAEADVYLAYGLHQQAEDLLRLALKEAPDRADYQEKLLETLYGAGKKDEFVQEAGTFRGLADGTGSRAWQRVVAMGKELAPDEAMFSGAADPQVSTQDLQRSKPETTDIELDAGGDSSIDFGLEEPEPETEAAAATPASERDDFSETVMFDTSEFEAVEGDAGLTEPDTGSGSGGGAPEAAEPPGAGDEALEFDLGDLEELGSAEPAASGTGADATGGGRTGAQGESEREGELEFDLGDLDLGGEARADESTDDSGPDPEATVAATGGTEFDLDLDALESGGAENTDESAGSRLESGREDAADAAAGSAGGDEALEFDLGDLDQGDTAEESTVAAGEGDDEGSFDLSDLGDLGETPDPTDLDSEFGVSGGSGDDTFAGDADETVAAGGGEAAAVAAPADEEEQEPALDFDIGGLDESPAGETTADGFAQGGEDTTVAGGGAVAGDAGDDEFDTMLDLARAYIDMGDSESASNALEEVIQSGNDSQQREARELLETVH